MGRHSGSETSLDSMPNGGVEQNTICASITSDSSEEQVQSRYLSPHVASCHDLCKHGKKQDSEVHSRRPNFRKFLKEKKKPAQTVDQSEAVTTAKTTSNVETEFHDDTDVSKPRTPPSTKNGIASGGKKTPQSSLGNEQGTKPKAISNIIEQKTKSSARKPISPVAPKVIQRKPPPSVSEAQTPKPHVSGRPAITLKTKTPLIRSLSRRKSSKSLFSRSNQENKAVASHGTSRNGGCEPSKPSPASPSSKPSRSPIDRGNMENKVANSLGSIKRASTPHGSVLGTQLRKLRSVKRSSPPHHTVSSLQPRNLRSSKRTPKPHESVSTLQATKLCNTKKTSAFHDIVLRFQPRKLRSMKRGSSDKANAESSGHSIHGATDEETEGGDNVVIEKKKSRRSTTVPARREDNTSMPFKLKFRRGKVINLRSDSVGARMLWVNIGRLASDNTDGGGMLWMKSFSRKSGAGIGSRDSDPEPRSVVLKHQGSTEKKDSKPLFNHFIEETASKLVETRKSKVRALVRAFETLISLHERKPAPTV